MGACLLLMREQEAEGSDDEEEDYLCAAAAAAAGGGDQDMASPSQSPAGGSPRLASRQLSPRALSLSPRPLV